jgi:type IV fimbrial biogenesis protein FimT
MPNNSGSESGLTVIELMIVLVLLAILMTLVAHPMGKLVHGTRVKVRAGQILTALNLARNEAILRNAVVSMCPLEHSETGVPHCGPDYAAGWVVFVNPQGNRHIEKPAEEVIRVYAGLPPGYLVTNRAGSRLANDLINYYPDGSSRRNLTLQLCGPPGSAIDSWSVIVSMAGRPRAASNWGVCSHG